MCHVVCHECAMCCAMCVPCAGAQYVYAFFITRADFQHFAPWRALSLYFSTRFGTGGDLVFQVYQNHKLSLVCFFNLITLIQIGGFSTRPWMDEINATFTFPSWHPKASKQDINHRSAATLHNGRTSKHHDQRRSGKPLWKE